MSLVPYATVVSYTMFTNLLCMEGLPCINANLVLQQILVDTATSYQLVLHNMLYFATHCTGMHWYALVCTVNAVRGYCDITVLHIHCPGPTLYRLMYALLKRLLLEML